VVVAFNVIPLLIINVWAGARADKAERERAEVEGH